MYPFRRMLVVLFLVSICLSGFAKDEPPVLAPLPQGFWLGTTISAHSVEGGQNNDWTAWEMIPGRIIDGSKSGEACNHKLLFEEDHQWMRRLGQNSALVSLEWSRIQPEQGSFNEAALAHYRKRIESMRGAGIEPVVILWDRTFPHWIAAQGGLENPMIILHFSEYASRVGREFSELVRFWIPLREPVKFAKKAYKDGIYPPGKSDVIAYGKAVVMFMGMHRGAWQSIKEAAASSPKGGHEPQVGLMMNIKVARPARPGNQMDISLIKAREQLSAKSFIAGVMRGDLISAVPQPDGNIGKGDPKADHSYKDKSPKGPKPDYSRKKADFLVIAYDGIEIIKFNIFKPLFTEKVYPQGAWLDEAGRIVFPQGIGVLARYMNRYPVPLFFMTGFADTEGGRRSAFINAHVDAIREAISNGANVQGFFYDSLLSGFEYEYGYTLKSGLINVNYQIQERTPAGGFEAFQNIRNRR